MTRQHFSRLLETYSCECDALALWSIYLSHKAVAHVLHGGLGPLGSVPPVSAP